MRDIQFWKSESGKSPVEEELEVIAKRDPKAFEKIYDQINLLAKYGFLAIKYGGNMEKVKSYKHLIEVKTKNKGVQYRLFCVLDNTVCWILHIFTKKKQKLPIKEMETASNRAKSIGFI